MLPYLCTPQTEDSVAQLVEHNTFNVGVLGSSPSWITKTESSNCLALLFLDISNQACLNEQMSKNKNL